MTENVKEILKSVLYDLKNKERVSGFDRVLKVWQGIIGEKYSKHTKIVYLTKDRIQVNVDNSSTLFELNLQKERIEKGLKKKLKIKTVRLKLGGIE